MAKVFAISGAISIVVVGLAYAVAMTTLTPLTQLFVFTGYSVAEALVPFIPDSVIRELTPYRGGPLVLVSALGTWFLVAWAICFYPVWRLRSNNALLSDASTSPLRAQRGAAKRER